MDCKADEMKDEALREYARKVNEWRSDLAVFVQKYGIFEAIQTEKQYLQIVATATVYQAGELLRLFPDIEAAKRKEVERATVELQIRVPKLARALDELARLSGAIEYHEAPRPDIDYTDVKGIPHGKARARIIQAATAYQRANKLAGDALERLQGVLLFFPNAATDKSHEIANKRH